MSSICKAQGMHGGITENFLSEGDKSPLSTPPGISADRKCVAVTWKGLFS
jgi:hypothetical protein